VSAPVPRPAAGSVDQAGERAVRRFVTVLAITVGGLCFLFSLGNVYQLAVDLRLWAWIRPLVAPAVDLSLVALVVGIRFLARRGLSGAELRRPRLFMLAVGLAAWALNTAGAVAERNWGRAAFDSLAPGLLLGWAEVLPWFLRQFHASTHPTAPSVPAPGGGPPAGNGALVPAMAASPGPAGVPAAALGGPPPASGGNGTGSGGTGTTRGSGRGAQLPRGTDPAARPVPPAPGLGNGGRNDNGPAATDAGMRAWWAAERAAGRTPTGAELDRVCGRDPNNGTGRKARARFLREEAAGRFHAPTTPPPGLPQAPQAPQDPVPVPTVAAAPAADAPAPDPHPGPDPAAPAAPGRRGPAPAPAGTGNPPRAAGPASAPDPVGSPRG
jgi:hypothetical protein